MLIRDDDPPAYVEGFYWFDRTTAPLAIGGRSRWIGYFNGHFWTFIGSDAQILTEELSALGVRVLSKIEEPA